MFASTDMDVSHLFPATRRREGGLLGASTPLERDPWARWAN